MGYDTIKLYALFGLTRADNGNEFAEFSPKIPHHSTKHATTRRSKANDNTPKERQQMELTKIMPISNYIDIKAERVGKSDRTSGDKFNITMTNTLNSKSINFEYHDNYHNQVAKNDIIFAILSDSMCYENNTDINDFAREFGFEYNVRECLEAYNGCKENCEKLHAIFTDYELDQLATEFEDY